MWPPRAPIRQEKPARGSVENTVVVGAVDGRLSRRIPRRSLVDAVVCVGAIYRLKNNGRNRNPPSVPALDITGGKGL